MHRNEHAPRRWTGLIVGGLLIVVGIVLLAAQLAGLDLGTYLGNLGWPAFVIVPGVALLAIGLVLRDEPGIGLSAAGGIVTTVGLLLWYQDATDHWSSWAYAWALVGPAAPGAAMALWGILHLRAGVLRAGLSMLVVGVVLFLVLFGFFEGILNIGGNRGVAPYGRQALPVALIALGVLIVLSRLWPRRAPRQESVADGAPPDEERPAV
jgi:hypothetical protein